MVEASGTLDLTKRSYYNTVHYYPLFMFFSSNDDLHPIRHTIFSKLHIDLSTSCVFFWGGGSYRFFKDFVRGRAIKKKHNVCFGNYTLDILTPFCCCRCVCQSRDISGRRSWHAVLCCTGFQRNYMLCTGCSLYFKFCFVFFRPGSTGG